MVSYERIRETITKARATVNRLAGLEADIAERQRLQDLGLLPEIEPSLTRKSAKPETTEQPSQPIISVEGCPQPPIETQDDADAARILSSTFAREFLMDFGALVLRTAQMEDNALRSDLQTLIEQRRRSRKKRSAADGETG
ncbi:hypothetical protein ACQR06_23465 [Bradyrhizobium sp. HKCCYLRH1065]|uniref:hypothetical protein n=1 Tax=Bradyrhizobium sp. HKCCYLRH1065 TaxID=3420753 RepID=UPI003EC0A5C1